MTEGEGGLPAEEFAAMQAESDAALQTRLEKELGPEVAEEANSIAHLLEVGVKEYLLSLSKDNDPVKVQQAACALKEMAINLHGRAGSSTRDNRPLIAQAVEEMTEKLRFA